MEYELKINKALATLNATLEYWYSFHKIVNSTMPDSEFRQLFNRMIQSLPGCYQIVVDALSPLFVINSQEAFVEEFDNFQQDYQKNFLTTASQPRHFTEVSHEYYIELAGYKELKIGYPILKRTFDNLYQFMDKWVANDAWIVMNCDVIFKTLNRLLLEIQALKKQDVDEAWLVYSAAKGQFGSQYDIFQKTLNKVHKV